MNDGPITHFGTVAFEGGQYQRKAGTLNWSVEPIPGFDPPIKVPLGMIRIVFNQPLPGPYTAVATAVRTGTTPMLAVNCGQFTDEGFVVHIFDPVATRTLQNGGFSFAVFQAGD